MSKRNSIQQATSDLVLKAQVILNENARFARLEAAGVDVTAKREAFASIFDLNAVRSDLATTVREYYSEPEDVKTSGKTRTSFKMKVRNALASEITPEAFLAFCKVEAFKVAASGTGENYSLGRSLQEAILDGENDSALADLILGAPKSNLSAAK
jgi:hypothetical protein